MFESDAGDYDIFYYSSALGFEPLSNNGSPLSYRYNTHWADDPFDASITCPPGVGTQVMSTAEQKLMVLAALADTVTQPSYDDELKWARQAGLYMALTVDDSLLDSDAIITAFYDSCFSENIGQLVRANEVMANRADKKNAARWFGRGVRRHAYQYDRYHKTRGCFARCTADTDR